MARMLLMLLLVGFTSACKQAPQVATPPALALPRPGVRLLATPNRGPACGATSLHVHFDWTVPAQQTSNSYDLHVDSPIGNVFASGGRNGHADTGDWAHVGQWFFLVANDSHEVLAAVRIGPDDCIQ